MSLDVLDIILVYIVGIFRSETNRNNNNLAHDEWYKYKFNLACEHDVGHSKPIITEHLKPIGLVICDVF